MFQLWYFQQPPQTIGPEIGPTIAIKGLTNFRHHLAYHTRTLSKISIACLPKTEMTHSLDELVTKLSLLSLQVRNWSRLTISGHAVFLNVSQTLFMVCSSWSFSDHNPFSCYLCVRSFAEVRPTYIYRHHSWLILLSFTDLIRISVVCFKKDRIHRMI